MTREEREQALEWFKNRPITMSGAKKMYDLAIAALEQPERKKGKWINGKCSECGEPKPISKIFDRGELVWDREIHINYCNNCGAEMEKGEE